MTLQTIPGKGFWLPNKPHISRSPTFSSSAIDLTGEKVAWVGRVFNKDRATKSIRKVHFLFGTVTKAGGSAMTVSLQDVSLSAGPPYRPDEVQDQTVAIANADAGFVSNVWYSTGNLSADRSVAHGELLSVVLEYDGSGRLGADVVNVQNLNDPDSLEFGTSGVVLKTGGTWGLVTVTPNILLEFSDGTFGTLDYAFPCSAVSNLSYKQDTGTADEYANELVYPFQCKTDGCWFNGFGSATTADYDVVLYDGTTAMTGGTVTCDAHASRSNAGTGWTFIPWSQEILLVANTTYRLAFKPTQTAANITIQYFDVAAANHLQAHDLGPSCALTSRLDLGSWAAPTTTRRLFAGLSISAVDDGAGGAAAPPVPSGRRYIGWSQSLT